MAAFHFTAKVHSRGTGASAVRAAAYRAAERLTDERLGTTADYTRKSDVLETAILAPESAPGWVHDRGTLWNRVEAFERRRDAQVAQEYELNLPREFSQAENWRLVTDFARRHLVSTGRVCDVTFHEHTADDGEAHPHAHILMPTRLLDGTVFGAKHPDVDWRNFKQQGARLQELRREWCEFGRARAAELGIDLGPDWDARSFADRGIDQEGQPKLGPTAARRLGEGEEAERAEEILAAQRRNGERLLADPGLALEALTHQQSTFTHQDLARWIHRHSDDDQFERIYLGARALAVPLGQDRNGADRFSTRSLIELERGMIETAQVMAREQSHPVGQAVKERVLETSVLSHEQEMAARQLLSSGDLACLVGYAGSGKSRMLSEVRRAYEAQGYTVRGAALSGIAAENLEQGSGIPSRTLHSLAHSWEKDRATLTKNDILVIDEAGMVGSRQMAGVLAHAKASGAKVILVGDPEQLQAIEAGAAFRAIADRTGAAELTEIRRQEQAWQRQATKELATGSTGTAFDRYADAGLVTRSETDDGAREALIRGWQAQDEAAPSKSRIMLAHERIDVRALNEQARQCRRTTGRLSGEDVSYDTNSGQRAFAAGDRFLFLRNDRELAVKNGTLGTVVKASDGQLQIKTDDGRQVRVDANAYQDFDHGYAVTIHKAQGVTVDDAHVLISRGFDRYLTYVAMSRQQESLQVCYGAETFKTPAKLKAIISRERAKDTTQDYELVNAAARELTAPAPVRPAAAEGDYDARLAARVAAATEEAERRAAEAQRRGPTL